MLLRENIPVDEALEEVECGTVPKNYKTMTVVFKEKELKIRKVLCSCHTTPIRQWQTATEKNLTDEVFLKSMPTQTMTLTDLEFVRKVSDISDIRRGEDDYGFMSINEEVYEAKTAALIGG